MRELLLRDSRQGHDAAEYLTLHLVMDPVAMVLVLVVLGYLADGCERGYPLVSGMATNLANSTR